MPTQQQFHDTPWFFGLMMVILFMVSYLFWGVLFVGPQRPQGPLQRGLHGTVGASNQRSSQRGMFPGMGGAGRRTEGGANQGGTRSMTSTTTRTPNGR